MRCILFLVLTFVEVYDYDRSLVDQADQSGRFESLLEFKLLKCVLSLWLTLIETFE
jgi:hypothetical protein